MGTADSANNVEDFEQVVSLNEAAKRLLRRSFEINLHALNAIVQSKQSGDRLRGFNEAASQIRAWSGELHTQLERLGSLVREAVVQASRFVKRKHTAGLLLSAVRRSGKQHGTAVVAGCEASLSAHRSELRALWRRIVDAVDDLNQLGLMACVLSRSAIIEATAAEPEQRAQLEEVTKDFYAKSEEVVVIVRGLGKTARSKLA